MSESLRDLLIGKARALSLIGATALVTTALVGGGAVAVSTVSNETSTAAKAAARNAPVGQQVAGQPQRSDTATAVLQDKKPRTPIACGDAETHGAFVSGTAQSLPKGPGRGEAVSAAARSDCGKPDGTGKPDTAGKPGTAGKPDKAKKPADTGPPAGKGKPNPSSKGNGKS